MINIVTKCIKIIGGNIYLFFYKVNNKLNHWYYENKFDAINNQLTLRGRLYCQHPHKVKVGKYCCINDGVILHAAGGIVMEDNVTISTDAKIITRSYDTSDWVEECNVIEPEKKHIANEIYLGNHTWIGASAIVLPGVRITGKGVIVASGSVLMNSIDEDYVLVAGSPAKIVKRYM